MTRTQHSEYEWWDLRKFSCCPIGCQLADFLSPAELTSTYSFVTSTVVATGLLFPSSCCLEFILWSVLCSLFQGVGCCCDIVSRLAPRFVDALRRGERNGSCKFVNEYIYESKYLYEKANKKFVFCRLRLLNHFDGHSINLGLRFWCLNRVRKWNMLWLWRATQKLH